MLTGETGGILQHHQVIVLEFDANILVSLMIPLLLPGLDDIQLHPIPGLPGLDILVETGMRGDHAGVHIGLQAIQLRDLSLGVPDVIHRRDADQLQAELAIVHIKVDHIYLRFLLVEIQVASVGGGLQEDQEFLDVEGDLDLFLLVLVVEVYVALQEGIHRGHQTLAHKSKVHTLPGDLHAHIVPLSDLGCIEDPQEHPHQDMIVQEGAPQDIVVILGDVRQLYPVLLRVPLAGLVVPIPGALRPVLLQGEELLHGLLHEGVLHPPSLSLVHTALVILLLTRNPSSLPLQDQILWIGFHVFELHRPVRSKKIFLLGLQSLSHFFFMKICPVNNAPPAAKKNESNKTKSPTKYGKYMSI